MPDMQLVTDVALTPCSKPRVHRPITNAIWTHDRCSTYHYEMSTRCQDFVTRYLGRSLITPHDESMSIVNRKMLELCFDVCCPLEPLHTDSIPGPSSLAAYSRPVEETSQWHWLKAISLFAARLDSPIDCSPKNKTYLLINSNSDGDSDADAIWATAAALVVLSFCTASATCPSQSWPLHPSAPLDLSWLTMDRGKMSLWTLTQPFRPASIFHIMAPTYEVMNAPLPQSGIEGILSQLVALCRLTPTCTATSSPYFLAAHALSPLLRIVDAKVSVGHSERFTKCISDDFRALLEAKDTVALTLMCLWYNKVGRCIWFIGMRAKIEGAAIESYLRRQHGRQEEINAALNELGGMLS